MNEKEFAEALKEAENLCGEAHRAYLRARSLRDQIDYNGAIEAAQHCIELSVKALYKLVGLKYPKKHDPATQLEEVIKRLKGLPDYQKVSIARAKWISKMWEWAHSTSIYGTLNVPASRIFKRKDAEIAVEYASEMHSCCSVTMSLMRTGQIKIV